MNPISNIPVSINDRPPTKRMTVLAVAGFTIGNRELTKSEPECLVNLSFFIFTHLKHSKSAQLS